MRRFFQIKNLEKFWLVLLMLLPVVFTVLAWWVVTQSQMQKVQTEFNHLAQASEKALQHRMDSYAQALLGGKGFFQGSSQVTRNDWRQYTLALNIKDNFPGINGIGVIVDVPQDRVRGFINKVNEVEQNNFDERPKGEFDHHYIIYYIEPIEKNQEAVGLNIGFEEHRRQAAHLAMETGQAAITKRILLVQDVDKTPGFLLLLPIESRHISSPIWEESFHAWIYAPFIARNFMANLTKSQGRDFHIEVYDETASADTLIYDSHSAEEHPHSPKFMVENTVEIMQQKWLIRWSSTPSFEANNIGQTPLFVLLFGSIFTLLVGLFLFLSFSKTGEENQSYQEDHLPTRYWAPHVVFMLVAIGSFLLHNKLYKQELDYLDRSTFNQLQQFDSLVLEQFNAYETRFNNIAPQWLTAGFDAVENKILWRQALMENESDMQGLVAAAFVDVQLKHVSSSVTLRENFDIASIITQKLDYSLRDRISKIPKASMMSKLIKLGQDHYFLTIHPVIKNEKPVSYMFALFKFEDFLEKRLKLFKIPEAYNLTIETNDVSIEFGQSPMSSDIAQSVNLGGQILKLILEPNQATRAASTSYFPKIVLLIGLAAALLIAMVVHFVQQLKLKARIIAEKQNLLETFITHAPMSLAMFDNKGRYMVASAHWYEFYQLKPQDVLGRQHSEETLWFKQGTEFSGERILRLEERLDHEDGSLLAWMRYVVCHWFKDTGESGGIIVFAENITEEKNMVLMKNEFVSTVNHELRTPLTAIQGALGLLQMGAKQKLEQKYQKLLQNSFENCQNLTRIVNDILDLEKMAAGELTFVYAETQLKPLLEQALRLNEAYAQKYHVNFELICPDVDIFVWVDPDRLLQCVSNLLSNAAKFSHADDLVTIRVTLEQRSVVIQVEDRGVGIPLAFQKKVFQRFAQADGATTRSKGGTGLGLSITQSMIKDMGGDINFNSIVDHGTTFIITLPVIQPSLESVG